MDPWTLTPETQTYNIIQDLRVKGASRDAIQVVGHSIIDHHHQNKDVCGCGHVPICNNCCVELLRKSTLCYSDLEQLGLGLSEKNTISDGCSIVVP